MQSNPQVQEIPAENYQMQSTSAQNHNGNFKSTMNESNAQQQTFLTGDNGLVNEDARIEIRAENHLLAQTSFEAMGLDSRFIQALLVNSF